MDQKTKFQHVLDVLRKKGWSEENITKLQEELAKTVYTQFYTMAVSSLTEEDLKTLDRCKSQDEANAKIKELYKLRTGLDPDEQALKFYDDVATKFLEDEHIPQPS